MGDAAASTHRSVSMIISICEAVGDVLSQHEMATAASAVLAIYANASVKLRKMKYSPGRIEASESSFHWYRRGAAYLMILS